PRILNQDFIAPPLEEELVTFIQELVYSGRCNMLSAIHTDQMHQPWRTFVATINRCNSRKTTRLDRLIEISSARKEHMPYPRFTKVIINHFISKDKTISMRNRIKHHTIRDDSLLGTLKIVSKTQDYEQYGALTPDDMINQDIKDSEAYKTYYDFATEKVPSMKARKYKKVASPSRKLSSIKEAEPVKKGKKVKRPAKKSTTAPTAGVVIRDTPAQLMKATKRSKKDFHISQASSSGDRTDFELGVPDEQQRKTSGTDEETDDNDDDSDDDSKGDDDKADSDDDDEEEYESDDDNENVFKEEDDDLYNDVNVRSLGVEQEQERKGDEEMTNADQNVTQEQSYEQVVEDAHVMLAAS
nr:hypothetical protein [Tanacetum cinerariifolium]